MQARDVMTSTVITVTPETTVRELAQLLVRHRISAAPVVDDDQHVIGMVSEGDLLHRSETDTDIKPGRQSWWLKMIGADGAADYVKANARTVGEIMSREPVCVTEDTALAEIASVLESHHIKRVPVLRGGRLAGIVSRSNLVQALASAAVEAAAPASASEKDIRAMLMGELAGHGWAFPGRNIVVRDGVVHLWGTVWSSDQLDAMRIAAERTPGVKRVEDHTIPYPIMPGI